MSDKDFEKETTALYEQILNLKEPFDLKSSHSENWKKIFFTLSSLAKKIAESKWPNLAVFSDNSESPSHKFTTLDYEQLDYEKTVLKILKHYNPNRISPKKNQQVTFWQYFIFILRNDIFKQATQNKIKDANKLRSFNLSVRQQRKINKLISILKIERKKNPDLNLNLNSPEAFKIFMDHKVCKDETELNNLLELNRNSFSSERINKKLQSKENYEIPTEPIFKTEEILFLLNIFFELLDDAFEKKMNLKNQSKENQKGKIIFTQEILTSHYLQKITILFDEIDFNEIIKLVHKKKFISQNILNLFINRENEIAKICASKNPDKAKLIKKLVTTSPMTLEKISLSKNSAKNYGSKRLSNFRIFFKATSNSYFENPPQKNLNNMQIKKFIESLI